MFNDRYGLTEAVLSGRKTQTRQICKHDRPDDSYDIAVPIFEDKDFDDEGNPKSPMYGAFCWRNDAGDYTKWNVPKYKVGEVVAVAQKYSDFMPTDKVLYRSVPEFGGYLKQKASDLKGWSNKMFVCADLMPHQIRITNVRIERLQDISDEDCIKVGVGISATDNRIGYPFGIPFNYYIGEDKKGCRYSTPREAYAALIDRISGKGTWERNPWVFVYDFELVK